MVPAPDTNVASHPFEYPTMSSVRAAIGAWLSLGVVDAEAQR